MSSLRRNVLSNVILTGSTVVLPLLTFPYVTKTLSATSFGQFLFIDSFTQYFILISSLGIPLYGLREIAKNKGDKEACTRIVLELTFIQIALSIILSFLFVGASFYIHEIGISKDLVFLGGVYIISSGFLIDWFYQGMEKFSYITIRSLAIKLCSVVAIFMFVKLENDNYIYYGVLTLTIFVNSLLNISYFFKNFFSLSNYSFNIRRHIKPLLILFSINASVSVYVILDSIILGFLTDSVNVSNYNIPLKIVKIYWTVIAAVGTVFIPKIAALHKTSQPHLISSLMSKSISVVLLLSLPFCFFCIVFPTEILMIISGPKYLEAKVGLQILSLLPLIIGICNIFGTQYLMPIGQEKTILRATIGGLIISVALNFLLIPKLNFLGSVIAATVTESFVCLFILIKARQTAYFDVDYSLLFQILLCLFLTYLLSYVILSNITNDLVRIISAFSGYVVFVLVSQIYFKNTFLNSFLLFKLRRKID